MSKLELRMLNYFMLIAFAAILIGIEFYFELNTSHSKEICSMQTAQNQIQDNFNPLDDIRTKILVMFALLSVVIAIVLIMFMKNITIPLGKMVEVAQHINEGDLSQTIKIDNHDEISEVGDAINELASNLQEVATFTSLTATDAIDKIQALKKLNTDNPENIKIINDIEKNLESMSSFVNSFKLFDSETHNA
ncbi:MAG: HAMP domain-containing protein [Gammaproteobacteria bacterium]|nr:HAMP domain-containing protein [Gammaproteobacteria bacterium]MDH5660607.1 HAMP domain-containing protein [Gammaproteobacteria bacterium]